MQIKPLPSQRLPKTLALYLSRIKIMILLIFLASFLLPSQSSAQISIDGNPIDWTNFGNHFQDAFGNGVVDSQYTQGSKDFHFAFDQRWEVGHKWQQVINFMLPGHK